MLPRLTLAGAFLACGQGSLFAFLVTYLNHSDRARSRGERRHLRAMTQITGIPGRIALGWLGDRLGSGLPVLRVLGVVSAATALVYAFTTPDWSPLALTLLAAVAGVTVSSWNGVQLAEIAREAPKGRVGETTSGATLICFVGYIVGPALFAALLAATGSWRAAFLAIAALSLAATRCACGRGEVFSQRRSDRTNSRMRVAAAMPLMADRDLGSSKRCVVIPIKKDCTELRVLPNARILR